MVSSWTASRSSKKKNANMVDLLMKVDRVGTWPTVASWTLLVLTMLARSLT